MNPLSPSHPTRVLYSFPHTLGASRICYTALQEVKGLCVARADVLTCPGSVRRSVSLNSIVWPTLSWGRLRIPYKLLGNMRAFKLHDTIISRRLERLAGQIDIVHVWPLGALETLKVSAKLGIPAVLERPNAHTQFAYEAVRQECERLGVALPRGHEHAYRNDVLQREVAEYNLATRILCPSDFVASTFLERGFSTKRLARHQYGFDELACFADLERSNDGKGLVALFVGGAAPRKGLHFALEAWLASRASQKGKFLIAGEFIPGYAERLSPMLSDPSVKVLGHQRDVSQLMRGSDILILPSIEEGSALVTYEARGCGCVLLVSGAAGAVCRHMDNSLVHTVGDVQTLTQQLNMLDEDRALLARLRTSSLSTVHELTWTAAGERLLNVYRETIEMHRSG